MLYEKEVQRTDCISHIYPFKVRTAITWWWLFSYGLNALMLNFESRRGKISQSQTQKLDKSPWYWQLTQTLILGLRVAFPSFCLFSLRVVTLLYLSVAHFSTLKNNSLLSSKESMEKSQSPRKLYPHSFESNKVKISSLYLLLFYLQDS